MFARLAVIMTLTGLAVAQGAPPQREHFQHADVLYDWVANGHGQKLRTFITRPKNTSGKVPAVFFVGWLSCDSMEYPDPNTRDGFGILIRRLIDESGFASVRMDKPGVGESQGVCAQADFQSELEGWEAAFESLSKYDFIDRDRIFVFGLSNGGGFSPLVTNGRPVRGFLSGGSWGRTWYEHMIDLERRRLAASGKSPAEVNATLKQFIDFYDLFLIKGLTPGEVIKQHPEWKAIWYDSPEGQYGRPAAFYQQLQALNLGEAWQNVDAPVLVIRGTADTIMSRADSEEIVRMVNQVHPNRARYIEIPGMSHGFTVNGKFYDELIPTTLNWMGEQLSK
jgi:pimeloyl-ACP methyl ester carboxylesterase